MARIRVLYISHNHPAVRPGGAEQYALELYEAMRDSENVEPVLVAKAGPPISSMTRHHEGTIFNRVGTDPNQLFAHTDGTTYDWLLGTSRDKELLTRHFRDFLLALQPDIVHIQHTLFFGYDLVRLLRRVLPEVPIVYTLHEFLPICHRNGQMIRTVDDRPCLTSSPLRCHECFPSISPQTFFMRTQLIKSHLEMVDRFIAPSRFLMERFVDWGIPSERMICEDYGRSIGDARTETRSHTDPPRRWPDRIGYFGQLSAFKGVTVALEAMHAIENWTSAPKDRARASDTERPEVGNGSHTQNASRPHLWVHGANLELQPGSFQNKFRELVRTAKHVSFVGPYESDDVLELMRSVDWVVVPSIWWENSPLVIQEAFASGRPVICSDIGGMAEKVLDGVNGLHFRAGDPRSLARQFKRAVESPALWNRLRSAIPDVHGMDRHVEVLVSLYEELLERAALPDRATRLPAEARL
jgi:glycosyltransferase involved in cell wall biosynthesis